MLASLRFLAAGASVLLKLALIGLVRAYQWTLSPLIGRNCRYTPTCSEYAVLAIERYGPLRGAWKAACRISRCHPWSGSGWDPP